jgi:HSP20 family protein
MLPGPVAFSVSLPLAEGGPIGAAPGELEREDAQGTIAMNSGPRDWMWSEALDMLARAEQMQRQLFKPRLREPAQPVCWEPPADMFETAQELIAVVALPGVEAAAARVTIENGVLEIFAERGLPVELAGAIVHRLELPQGCFKRQLRLPPGAYGDVRSSIVNGCLVVTLRKITSR